MNDLTPQQIVAELDRYIIGQHRAKKAVAVALRNRQRRRSLPPELRDEIRPKNILMIGPTGVGKTEIARRLARLVNAPFLKVEATKFTEVGYVGRDVESIIKDLAEIAVRMVKEEKTAALREKARANAERRLLRILAGLEKPKQAKGPFDLFGVFAPEKTQSAPDPEEQGRLEMLRERYYRGELEDEMVQIEVVETPPVPSGMVGIGGLDEIGQGLQEFFSAMLPKKVSLRQVTVAEAREILTQQETEKLIDWDDVYREAVTRVEESGIVFIDEIDKIVGGYGENGPDVSREGVQRDILPIVEGTTVWTKYGPVKTDYILFIAAGAFHVSKPSELIPEFQGRFPIRVELESLTVEDFERILVEPENALLRQEKALLESEGLQLEFTKEAIRTMAELAYQLNKENENIGARRLYTILEQVLEDISFRAVEYKGQTVRIDENFVRERLDPILKTTDLSRYIL
ncbi:MAG TPA: ATP-dependent protease ATPase subunit HslU [Firmicutes bacterium]|uniref:ATP-dependent protease ATPase subunit HslU n=1 Tax=Capillibacterium thermochitinicola TaxID=2699427 RepID=A0A8J6I0S6_9FIRM|nr:ATP-dependent protease ATPase subunit HslU [Capillibacterium thermochitinicola]MBA2132217.1 ATP-dependent protease ATPase subunit HslU [Capillibacterium thermochitinicola]HHW11900.1 ATP-dependent protease ATPase subunit HslU [Bacillota bacterium]